MQLIFKDKKNRPSMIKFLMILILGFSPELMASMPQDPLPSMGKATSLSPVLCLSDVGYDPENGSEFDIERRILGLGVGFSLGSQADGEFGLGVITKTEVENINEDGDGYQLLFGAKGMVHRSGKMAVNVNGSFSWLAETIKNGNTKVDIETTELRFGSTVNALVSPKFMPYAGLDLALMSDGTLKFKNPGVSSKLDFERDDMLGLRIGTKFLLGQVALKAEALLMGERTITVGADLYL
jgi:hypothetical protein